MDMCDLMPFGLLLWAWAWEQDMVVCALPSLLVYTTNFTCILSVFFPFPPAACHTHTLHTPFTHMHTSTCLPHHLHCRHAHLLLPTLFALPCSLHHYLPLPTSACLYTSLPHTLPHLTPTHSLPCALPASRLHLSLLYTPCYLTTTSPPPSHLHTCYLTPTHHLPTHTTTPPFPTTAFPSFPPPPVPFPHTTLPSFPTPPYHTHHTPHHAHTAPHHHTLPAPFPRTCQPLATATCLCCALCLPFPHYTHHPACNSPSFLHGVPHLPCFLFPSFTYVPTMCIIPCKHL